MIKLTTFISSGDSDNGNSGGVPPQQEQSQEGVFNATLSPENGTDGPDISNATEATAVYGPVVVQLDSDLSSNVGTFPEGPAYFYDQTASLSQMLGNLNIPSLVSSLNCRQTVGLHNKFPFGITPVHLNGSGLLILIIFA